MQQALWWQRGVIYQIYPRSFMDSDGDGVGDLPGIIERLGYLADLGVDAIWISPIYPSPMADFGYDVADYCAIDRLFGNLADFDRLVAAAHACNLRVILDFVPNHTSDEHPWFAEARAGRDSPRRDWYIWRDPAPDGGPPNNWLSIFGGSAWAYDEPSGQYYLHLFLDKQPDLNWRNPAVVQAMHAVLRFWLDRGVDGFRIDVIWLIMKDEQFRDNPPNPAYRSGEPPINQFLPIYSGGRPEVHGAIAAMRRLFDAYAERVMIGEFYLPVDELMSYYGSPAAPECHLPFNFQLIGMPWHAPTISAAVAAYEAALPPGGWPNWVLGNHDQHRIASRIGPRQARVAAILLLTLRGTPTLYYGDEIGMHDVDIPPELVRDPQELGVPGFGLGRDPERTPMQWDAGQGAGFSSGTPWLPLAGDYASNNVAAQLADSGSMLALYRRLLALRRAAPALATGSYALLAAEGDLLIYQRAHAGQCFVVALNLGAAPQQVTLPGIVGRVALSTWLDRDDEDVDGTLALRADEGVIVEVRA